MCKFCEHENNDFLIMNPNSDLSCVEIAMNKQGMLRVRSYTESKDLLFDTQDIVNINYCPICGRKLRKDLV